jgi:EAL domain-containing protein (putative c-di-GMP-specific phosphodiesterase class I)/GGDEF domain-containing protein
VPVYFSIAHVRLVFALVLALAFLLGGKSVAAKENVVGEGALFPASLEFQFFEDGEHQYDFDQIDALPDDAWTSTDAGGASFGFTRSQYWIKADVVNRTSETQNLVLEIDYVLLDNVVFKGLKSNGELVELATGDTRPFYPRHIDHPSILFRFQLHSNESIAVIASVKTKGSMLLPMYLWGEKEFLESAAGEQKVHFFFYGALTVILAINLAVFFTLRERLYLFYALAVFGYLTFFASSRGFIQQAFLPHAPDLNSRVFLISMPFLALFSLLFARNFMRTYQGSKIMDKAILAMIAFEIFNLSISIFLDYDFVVRVSAVGGVLLFLVLFFAGPVSWMAGKRSGIFFTIAWIPLTMGFAITTGRSAGFLPNNFWTEYAMQLGSGLEALILTLALADRLYREREKKIHAQAQSLDVAQQRNRTQSLLAQTMSRDPVTQLLNRNRFEWLVRNTLMENPNRRYFISVLNMSRVDDITRTLGVSSSERLLRQVANMLQQDTNQLPGVVKATMDDAPEEGLFQVAGATFGALVEQEAFEANSEVFYEFLRKLGQPILFENLSLELSPRFGSALYPKHGTDPTKLIRNALVALDSPTLKSGLMGVYHSDIDIYDESRLTMLTELRQAIESDALALAFQPKLDMHSNGVTGVEALLRWSHPKLGFVPPDNFIPLAEKTGIIDLVTQWVFRQVVDRMVELHASGYTGSMSINISARNLHNPHFADQLVEILDQTSLSADMFYLELTETAAMEDPALGLTALQRLADRGFKIAIDDFGAGYSSLSYLQRLPASEIKLDRSLIVDVCESQSSKMIVKTFVDMAHALNFELVAEGVEDEPTAKVLRNLDCDRFQGYWIARPMPFNDIRQWLREHGALKAG